MALSPSRSSNLLTAAGWPDVDARNSLAALAAQATERERIRAEKDMHRKGLELEKWKVEQEEKNRNLERDKMRVSQEEQRRQRGFIASEEAKKKRFEDHKISRSMRAQERLFEQRKELLEYEVENILNPDRAVIVGQIKSNFESAREFMAPITEMFKNILKPKQPSPAPPFEPAEGGGPTPTGEAGGVEEGAAASKPSGSPRYGSLAEMAGDVKHRPGLDSETGKPRELWGSPILTSPIDPSFSSPEEIEARIASLYKSMSEVVEESRRFPDGSAAAQYWIDQHRKLVGEVKELEALGGIPPSREDPFAVDAQRSEEYEGVREFASDRHAEYREAFRASEREAEENRLLLAGEEEDEPIDYSSMSAVDFLAMSGDRDDFDLVDEAMADIEGHLMDVLSTHSSQFLDVRE